MAEVRNRADQLRNDVAYSLVRRAQAGIARYRHFDNDDLSRYMDRDAFEIIAKRLTDRFFHRSIGLDIHEQVQELYRALLVMAPVLQRIPLSSKIDWHRGHLISFFRANINGRRNRFHFLEREVDRVYNPELLGDNLASLGVHDSTMVCVLSDLYRRHAGGATLKDRLAHQMFDPLLMASQSEGFELRHGNLFYRFEKTPFRRSIDLRNDAATILDFQIRSVANHRGHHLEILISDETLAQFRDSIVSIIASAAAPSKKVLVMETRVRDFVEKTRWARSAFPQVKELQLWLRNKCTRLAATYAEAGNIHHLLVNLWLQRADSHMYLKQPNFFLDPKSYAEKTYVQFFSPYREAP